MMIHPAVAVGKAYSRPTRNLTELKTPSKAAIPSEVLGVAPPRQSGSYLNFAPPNAASYISPPLMIEKETMPFS